MSWNVALDDLYPAEFTLAILLPIMSMRVWCALRPETPANIERIIFVSSFSKPTSFVQWVEGFPKGPALLCDYSTIDLCKHIIF